MSHSDDPGDGNDRSRQDTIAVALAYEPTRDQAPRVVAGGRGAIAEQILQAAKDVVAAGQTISSGAPELPNMKKAAGLKDITSAERDWAWEQIKPKADDAQGADSTAADPSGEQPAAGAEDAKDPADEADAAAMEDLPEVSCALCDREVDAVEQVVDSDAGQKVYVSCHGQRQGVPFDPESDEPIVAFREQVPEVPEEPAEQATP